ncbi:hypothetical protein FVA74_10945 [Salinibacterium sp. dk2585]|uniref:hypothetical protein n=1 Tax=unclassified Salinibacterium TaxID=2632331 RepID=UPI0011C2467C|nr:MULTISPECIES: hypothetical protein [unclassified Salinibacterium]QEE62028.1 hypothetical protein FVA74_10945 [Salinibacterium sp. dk2585]TXK54417.1 hypothetical protein FVP63_05015 [Salinibacterium sp. dk5596]
MNTTSNDYLRLAPSVNPAWVEDFVLELRLLDVPGTRIGDALALVESHVAESGETAQDAFGDAREYAKASARGQVPDALDFSWILGSVFGLVGMLLTIFGVQAWVFDGGVFELSVGTLVLVAMVLAAVALLHFRSTQVLRFAVRHTWFAVAIFALWSGAILGALLLFPAIVAEIPAAIVAALGVAALTLGSVLEWRSKSAQQLDDPIVGPGEQPKPSTTWFARVMVLQFPILTVVMLAFGLLLTNAIA